MVKGKQPNSRGLDRERLNSSTMKLRGYDVIDDPEVLPSDGLNTNKNPDHRIDGKVYDSYSPTIGLYENNQYHILHVSERKRIYESETGSDADLLGESNLPYELPDYTLDQNYFFDMEAKAQLKKICQERIVKGIAEKVAAGQTKNILLNATDMPYPRLGDLFDESLAKSLNGIKNLDSVIGIFPRSTAKPCKEMAGKGELWNQYLASHMDCLQWEHGEPCFKELKRSVKSDDNSDSNDSESPSENESDNRDDTREDNRDGGESNRGSDGNRSGNICPPGPGGILGGLFASFALFGIFGIFSGLIGLIFFSFCNNSRKKSHISTPVSESEPVKNVIGIYRSEMKKIYDSPDEKLVWKIHTGLGRALVKISSFDDPAIKDIIEHEIDIAYEEIKTKRTINHLLTCLFNNPIFLMLMLFLYLTSRGIRFVIFRFFQPSRTISSLLSVMLLCSILSYVSKFLFLRIVGRVFDQVLGMVLVALIIWLIVHFRDISPSTQTAIDHIAEKIWDEVEVTRLRYRFSSQRKFNIARDCVILLVLLLCFVVISRVSFSLSQGYLLFKPFDKMFRPVSIICNVFGWFAFLGKSFIASFWLCLVCLFSKCVAMFYKEADYFDKKLLKLSGGRNVSFLTRKIWEVVFALVNTVDEP